MIDIHMLAGAPPASDLLWHDVLVAAAPHIIWACVLTGFAIWLGPKIVPSFMRRIRKIGYRGLEIELTGEIRESAIERAQPVSARQTSRIVHRLTASARLLESAHILWVDDEPENNRREVEILEELGAKIVLARTTAEARSFVENSRFDVLIPTAAESDSGGIPIFGEQ